MNKILTTAMALAGLGLAGQAWADITFYERDGFQGRSYATQKQVSNFESVGFNDRASSVIVTNDRWEACEHSRFGGRCVVLRPGQYPSLAAMGLNDSVSSVRMIARNVRVDDNRYAPMPVVERDYRRRRDERTYEAEVTSVRAVMEQQTEQRCWVEREQAPQARGDANVGGAIAGAVIGGILGHQVGGGRGKDLATAGGAVAGGYVGSNVGRNDSRSAYGQDVRRCENVPTASTPHHWDVTYSFQGVEHRMQMNTPPGRTVLVNSQGEPRA